MRTFDPELSPDAAFSRLRRAGSPALLLDGRGGHDGAWPCRLALAPTIALKGRVAPAERSEIVSALDGLVARRRAAGGPGGTGVAVLYAYEAFAARPRSNEAPWDILALEVDAGIAFPPGEPPHSIGRDELALRAARTLEATVQIAELPRTAASGRPRTSLARDAYLRAVTRVKEHIARGDVYQINLTQRFEAEFAGDAFDLYRALARATPAPRSAYVEVPGLALASVSPEVFVDVDRSRRAETRPIKGTRPRGASAKDDARAAAELLSSAKDRAELVMIVDVLRNDLGRVARTGSVSVPELMALRSYAAVHHLVARVVAELRHGLTPGELLTAVMPGGSITGAPKPRAVELVREIEPCPRGLYTGSLVWLDDDGSMASSILIRSAIVTPGIVRIGAGGGVVADSIPEAEWLEANAKARALTLVLGFDPEEAV